MNPGKYLVAGASVVAVLICGIVTQSWFAGSKAAVQHQNFLRQQEMDGAIDDLRAAVNRLVSSINETALITLASRQPGATETAASKDAEDDEEKMIAEAKVRGTQAIALLSDKTKADGIQEHVAFAKELTADYMTLVSRSDELHKLIEDGNVAAIIEAKGAQEDAEMNLLGKVNAMSGQMRADLSNRASTLTAELSGLKFFSLLAGLVSGAVLFVVSLFLTRRISGMFRQISAQNTSIESINSELSSALVQLRNMQDSLVEREKFSTLGRLTATVSHELRNPLSAVRNVLFAMGKKNPENTEIQHMVARGERSVARCDHIIADLLEYTRSRALDKKPTDVGKMIIGVIEETSIPADVTCEITLPENPVMIDLDEYRFSRVIINLVENAGHAIAAMQRPGVIRVTCSDNAEGVQISVEDNGAGIPEGIRQKIFDALFTTKNFGAGLGLSICKNLVQEHGGTIGFDSILGSGTTFKLFLPKSSADRPESIAA